MAIDLETRSAEQAPPTPSHAGESRSPIGSFTERLPSDAFLYAALASIGGSLALRLMDRRDDALFVGQWAPTLLILGLYGKIVKAVGRDVG